MNKTLLIALLSGATCLMLILFFHTQSRVYRLERQLDSYKVVDHHENEEAVLLGAMERFQRFGTKLWFAGEHENWELASFYVHEIEEVIEELAASNIEEEGHLIRDLVEKLPEPALEVVEEGVHKQDREAFRIGYKQLVNACNACHAATNKPFIQIGIPEKASKANQIFRTVGASATAY